MFLSMIIILIPFIKLKTLNQVSHFIFNNNFTEHLPWYLKHKLKNYNKLLIGNWKIVPSVKSSQIHNFSIKSIKKPIKQMPSCKLHHKLLKYHSKESTQNYHKNNLKFNKSILSCHKKVNNKKNHSKNSFLFHKINISDNKPYF